MATERMTVDEAMTVAWNVRTNGLNRYTEKNRDRDAIVASLAALESEVKRLREHHKRVSFFDIERAFQAAKDEAAELELRPTCLSCAEPADDCECGHE